MRVVRSLFAGGKRAVLAVVNLLPTPPASGGPPDVDGRRGSMDVRPEDQLHVNSQQKAGKGSFR